MFTQDLKSHVLKAGEVELNEQTLFEGIFTCMFNQVISHVEYTAGCHPDIILCQPA